MQPELALICLAILGGLWAVAWGNRRVGVPDKDRMVDVRTQLQVRLDALRARAVQLRRSSSLDDDARARVDQVIEHHVIIDSVLASAGSADDVERLRPQVERSLRTLEEAAAGTGLDLPADRPFHGLCANDPEHGPEVATDESGRRICGRCRDDIVAGRHPTRRLVSADGNPVPFDALPERSPAD